MQSQMVAFALCIVASTAGAHTLPVTQTAQTDPPHRAAVQASQTRAAAAEGRSQVAPARPGIIAAAGAATSDIGLPVREGASVARATIAAPLAGDPAQQEHGNSTSMMLAALALMVGIAVRRLLTSDR